MKQRIGPPGKPEYDDDGVIVAARDGGRFRKKSGRSMLRTVWFSFYIRQPYTLKIMQYYVGKNGQQLGPFGEEQVKARVAAGEFSAADLIWREGMASWEPISTVFNNPYLPSAALGASPLLAAQAGQALAGRGARLGAVLLNGLINLAAVLPGGILLGIGSSGQQGDTLTTLQPMGIGLIQLIGIGLMLLGGIALAIYQLMLYLRTGQTIGKKLMGVRVVKFTDGTNPGFGGLVGLREIVPAVIGMVPLLGGIFSIVDACFIFRGDQRCIHDLMANTKVIRA
jgi:uncharacterized RDD family membrane protein YckC